MSTLSEYPLDIQFAHAVSLLNRTANDWPSLEQLTNLSCSRAKGSSVQLVGTEADETPAQKALSALSEVSENASLASVLSTNEDLDEIGTSHLKYLLLPFLIASAHADWQGEQGARLQHLSSALEHLTAFFMGMDRLRLLPLRDRDRVLGDASEQQTEPPVETREEKIVRFKAEKAAQLRLSLLIERMRARKTVLTAGNEYGAERSISHDVDADTDEEEIIREATLVLLRSAVHRALDLHGALLREIPLLQWAQRQRSRGVDPRERVERARPRGPPPSVVPGMPPSFRIVSERERERANVFRPSHSLPTYSVEEWGRIEAERLAQAEQEKQQKDVVAKRQTEEDESSDDDDHTLKEKRRWDDWKDDHNRGSGNTIR